MNVEPSEWYKTLKFREYVKNHKLWDYAPPGSPKDMQQLIFQQRRRNIIVLELMFPDFKEVYEKLKDRL